MCYSVNNKKNMYNNINDTGLHNEIIIMSQLKSINIMILEKIKCKTLKENNNN